MNALAALLRRAWDRELARFGLIGVGATVFYALASLTLIAAGLAPTLASALAYGLAALVSYAGHKLFTFASDGAHRVEGPRYAVVNGFSFLLAVGAPSLAERLGGDARLGVLAACIAVPAFNYVAMKLYVFPRGSGEARKRAANATPSGLGPTR